MEHGASGQLGAVAARADDRGADSLASQREFSPAEPAFPDSLSQNRPQIAEFQPWKLFFDAVRHAAGEGNDQFLFPAGVKPPRFPGGQLLQQGRFLPQTRRHFQRLRQNFGHGFHLPGACLLPRFQAAQPIQNRGNIGDGAAAVKFQQPPAHVQAAGSLDFPVADQGEIAGSAADVHVQHRFSCPLGVVHCPRALGGQYAFQIGASGGHHELPGKIRQSVQHRPGVFLAAGLARDDDGAGVHAFPADARLPVFLRHQLPQRPGVHVALVQQGRKIHRTAVADVPPGDLHLRHRKARRFVFHRQLREDHLGGSGSHVQPHASQNIRHGRSPLPESAAPENPPLPWGSSCSRGLPA